MYCVRNAPRKQVKWWAILFLPLLLRALVPVGFMPMAGANYTLQLVVCDGDGPLTAPPSMPMSMHMPAGMAMDMPPGMSMDGSSGSAGSAEHHHGHDDRGTCPYGSAPALGGLPALALLPRLLIQRSVEASLATSQVAYVEVSRRAQSPRAPPV
jgi:hypothetical protein